MSSSTSSNRSLQQQNEAGRAQRDDYPRVVYALTARQDLLKNIHIGIEGGYNELHAALSSLEDANDDREKAVKSLTVAQTVHKTALADTEECEKQVEKYTIRCTH